MPVGHRDFMPNVSVLSYGTFGHDNSAELISDIDWHYFTYGFNGLFTFGSFRCKNAVLLQDLEMIIQLYVDGDFWTEVRSEDTSEYYCIYNNPGPLNVVSRTLKTHQIMFGIQGPITIESEYKIAVKQVSAGGNTEVFQESNFFYNSDTWTSSYS